MVLMAVLLLDSTRRKVQSNSMRVKSCQIISSAIRSSNSRSSATDKQRSKPPHGATTMLLPSATQGALLQMLTGLWDNMMSTSITETMTLVNSHLSCMPLALKQVPAVLMDGHSHNHSTSSSSNSHCSTSSSNNSSSNSRCSSIDSSVMVTRMLSCHNP
jgi:hypothetical protein